MLAAGVHKARPSEVLEADSGLTDQDVARRITGWVAAGVCASDTQNIRLRAIIALGAGGAPVNAAVRCDH